MHHAEEIQPFGSNDHDTLYIIFPGGNSEMLPEGALSVSSREARAWPRNGTFFGQLFKYRHVIGLADSHEYLPMALYVAVFMRLLSRDRCLLLDRFGAERHIGPLFIARRLVIALRDLLLKGSLFRRATHRMGALDDQCHTRPKQRKLPSTGHPLYLRTDLWLGVQSGGSIGHIAGVLNNLEHFFSAPIFITSDWIPTVSKQIETHRIGAEDRFVDYAELPTFAYNETLIRTFDRDFNSLPVAFIYQRYGLNNHTGLYLAHRLSVPFVLEYNGSEVWVSNNWGTPLKYQYRAIRNELLNLRCADLVVVVSQPIHDELVGRGVDPARILVNPNGVDPDRYSPEISGKEVRTKLGLNDAITVGFIGTFGLWHGAEVLAEAFGRLLAHRPDLRDSARLLMIGDGRTMPKVKEIVATHKIQDAVIFTGIVPQAEGPAHLAACDILISPHVPNPDGSRFFGSPTKLFEYMAMGKGIVASDLDQIGEVLEHDHTAWMVPPADADALADGIAHLIDEPALRSRLGQAARQTAVARHTWREHTRKIAEALKARCG